MKRMLKIAEGLITDGTRFRAPIAGSSLEGITKESPLENDMQAILNFYSAIKFVDVLRYAIVFDNDERKPFYFSIVENPGRVQELIKVFGVSSDKEIVNKKVRIKYDDSCIYAIGNRDEDKWFEMHDSSTQRSCWRA